MDINTAIEKLKEHPQNKVIFGIPDIDGIIRGKIIHKQKFIEALNGTLGFCDVVYGWDANDVCYTNIDFTGWHSGYPDAEIHIDVNTFRMIPWDNNIPFFLGDIGGNSQGVCSRSLLKSIENQVLAMDMVPFFSMEYEWFNFEENPSDLASREYKNPKPITPGMFGYSLLRPSMNSEFFNSLFDYMEQFDVKLEGMHSETGPGVFEAAILFDRVLYAADKATLFKLGVKEIARKFGFIASFMAKWNDDLPGSGGHIHQSLWDKSAKRNLFYEETGSDRMSEIMKSYLAGQLYCLPFILPMYAPTVNSYKRLKEGAWAPTTLTWGVDNRTAAFRVIGKNDKSTRIETRVAGADVNPYLAMATSLASGLYGIKKNLKLQDNPIKGNAYQNTETVKLSTNLGDAINAMKNSHIAYELFGEPFVNHFIKTREWEWQQFLRNVTDWEMKRYFEII